MHTGLRSWAIARAIHAAVLAAAIPQAAHADGFTFNFVTGSSNPVGGVRPAIARAPSIHGGIIAFNGVPVGSPRLGIHTLAPGGVLTTIAMETGPLPGGVGTFSTLGQPPVIHDGAVAFHAFTSLGRGIFTNVGGMLVAAAAPAPALRWGFNPSIDGQIVAFGRNDGSDGLAVHTWTPGGGMQTVATRTMPNPLNPANPIGDLGLNPVMASGRVVFVGLGLPRGLYSAEPDGSALTVLASSMTPLPGGSGLLGYSKYILAADGDAVVVHAGDQSVNGLFTNLGGAIRAVATRTTPIPGGAGTFSSFELPDTEFSISGSFIAFSAPGPGGQRGIYGEFGNGLEKVVALGDVIDGLTLTDFWFGRDALHGDQLVFTGTFSDGSTSIYIVTVPAPGAALAVVLGGVMGFYRRRG